MREPEILPPVPAVSAVTTATALYEGDDLLIELWLGGRPQTTRKIYERAAWGLLDYTGKTIPAITLRDLQEYHKSLADLAPGSQAVFLKSLKSLFTFGQKTGHLVYNVGAALILPRVKNTLAERILTEADVDAMLRLEKHPRNKAILQTLYFGGLRISELAGLRVRDLKPRENGEGQATIFGKGGKTGVIILVDTVWASLAPMIAGRHENEPVFASRQQGRALGIGMVHLIVKKAAARAGLSEKVSSHFLRHSCASHAIAQGADLGLVRDHLRHASVSTTNNYIHAAPNKSAARFLKR